MNYGVINESDGVDNGRESVVVAQNNEDNLDATPLVAFTTMSSATAYQDWQNIKKNTCCGHRWEVYLQLQTWTAER